MIVFPDRKRYFRVSGRHSGPSVLTETWDRVLSASGDRPSLQRAHFGAAGRTAPLRSRVTCNLGRQKVESRSGAGRGP